MGNKTFHHAKEGDLIAAALQGDHSCLSELYTRYYPKVTSRCISFVKDKAIADDLAQDILLKAIEKLPSFQLKASFSSWLYAIATNHCLEYLRKEKKHLLVSLEEGLHISNDELERELQLQQNSLERELDIYLKQLSQKDRKLLISKYCDHQSIQELQNNYHLSASAIKMRLMRSKQKLAQLFGRADDI